MGWKPIEGYLIRKTLKGGSPSMDFRGGAAATKRTVTLETKRFKCFLIKFQVFIKVDFIL
jgi:hypothetical protein